MSYVGKVLVVVQVVMSLLFMTFAGAVYAVHQNWRTKYEATQASLEQTQKDLSFAQAEASRAKTELQNKFEAEQQRANDFAAKNATLEGKVQTLTQEVAQLTTQRATQTGLAEAKAAEARFRFEEAEKQRIENSKLQSRMDELAAENRQLKDDLFTKNESFRHLNELYETGLAQLSYLKEVVTKNGLETDPGKVAAMKAPPPPVEGLVTRVKENRAGRVQFVEISIGSDDGLRKGNELDVVRVYGTDSSEWLGRVKVVDLGPDWSVAEVMLPSKNGIIGEGDNVTTKLNL